MKGKKREGQVWPKAIFKDDRALSLSLSLSLSLCVEKVLRIEIGDVEAFAPTSLMLGFLSFFWECL